jgi:hypothetical protein
MFAFKLLWENIIVLLLTCVEVIQCPETLLLQL